MMPFCSSAGGGSQERDTACDEMFSAVSAIGAAPGAKIIIYNGFNVVISHIIIMATDLQELS